MDNFTCFILLDWHTYGRLSGWNDFQIIKEVFEHRKKNELKHPNQGLTNDWLYLSDSKLGGGLDGL